MIPMSISKVVCSPSAIKIRRQMDAQRNFLGAFAERAWRNWACRVGQETLNVSL